MTLFSSPEASLTYHAAAETLCLSYSATHLTAAFAQAYHLALAAVLDQNVGKLLLDLKRNAPPTDESEELLRPLATVLAGQLQHPLFVAAVVSEGQYQYQIGNSITAFPTPPHQVEFNYFTSRRDATRWLSEN